MMARTAEQRVSVAHELASAPERGDGPVAAPTAVPLGLECRELALAFGRIRALDGLTLSVAPGESVGIVGRNGAGKSTLFRCIIGAETPDAGTVQVTPALDRLAFLARTGFVPDTLSAYDWMRSQDAIEYVARLQPAFDRAWSMELCALLGIDRGRRVRDLSRGGQARLAFVLGLSHRPDLVLLDEPLLGVDAVTHDAVLELLARMRATQGCTMLVASHQLGDLARLTDRIVILDRGRLVESIPTDELVMGTKRLVVRGVPEAWSPPFDAILTRRQGEAIVVTIREGHCTGGERYGATDADRAVEHSGADARASIAAIVAAHPGATVELIDLSINEACADRLRALEVQP